MNGFKKKVWFRALTACLACLFAVNAAAADFSAHTLSPESVFMSPKSADEIRALAVARLIEQRAGEWEGKSIEEIYTDDIVLWARSTDPDFDGFGPEHFELSVDKNEIIIRVPGSNVVIRYYNSDPRFAQTLARYTDWAGTSTEVINTRINRQITRRAKALPAPSQIHPEQSEQPRRPGTDEGISPLTDAAFRELDRGVGEALKRYSNVHRGNGQHSAVSTELFEKAREIVLEYLDLDKEGRVVIFGNSRSIGLIRERIKFGADLKIITSNDIGLPLGVTALAVKKEDLPKDVPPVTGGGIVRLVSKRHVIWADPPDRFEAGTPNIIGIITFAKALKIVKHFGRTDIFAATGRRHRTVSSILYRGAFGGYSGQALFDRLKSAIIGNGSLVPTADGERPYVNFDNGASTPCFAPVWDTVREVLRQPKRVLDGIVREAENIVLKFFGASEKHEVIFTANTTEGLNIIADNLKHPRDDGTETVVINTLMEHHSNELPWRYVPGVSLKSLVTDNDGFIGMKELEECLRDHNELHKYGAKHVKIVSVSGASNVLGSFNNIREISRIAHRYGASVVVDAAQLAAHRQIDMTADGIDYLVCSGHKMYAPFGAGALVARKDLLNYDRPALEALKGAGAQNVAGIAAMAKSMLLMRRAGMDNLEAAERSLTARLLRGLRGIPGVKIYGISDPDDLARKGGVVTFNVKGMPHNLVAKLLAERGGVGVRNGCFCAHMLLKQLVGVGPFVDMLYTIGLALFPKIAGKFLPGLVRVSLGIENTEEEVDRFLEVIRAVAGEKVSPVNRLLGNMSLATPFLPDTAGRTSIDEFARRIVERVYGVEADTPGGVVAYRGDGPEPGRDSGHGDAPGPDEGGGSGGPPGKNPPGAGDDSAASSAGPGDAPGGPAAGPGAGIRDTFRRLGIVPSYTADDRFLTPDAGSPHGAAIIQGLESFRGFAGEGPARMEQSMEIGLARPESANSAFANQFVGTPFYNGRCTYHLRRLGGYAINLARGDFQEVLEGPAGAELGQIVNILNPSLISVHLGYAAEDIAFGAVHGHDFAESAPLDRQTLLERICANISTLKRKLEAAGYRGPLLLETLDYYKTDANGAYNDVTDPGFIRDVLTTANKDGENVRLLIDTSHILVAAKNSSIYPPDEYMRYVRSVVNEDTIGLIDELHIVVPKVFTGKTVDRYMDIHQPLTTPDMAAEEIKRILKYIFNLRILCEVNRPIVLNFETGIQNSRNEIQALSDTLCDLAEHSGMGRHALRETIKNVQSCMRAVNFEEPVFLLGSTLTGKSGADLDLFCHYTDPAFRWPDGPLDRLERELTRRSMYPDSGGIVHCLDNSMLEGREFEETFKYGYSIVIYPDSFDLIDKSEGRDMFRARYFERSMIRAEQLDTKAVFLDKADTIVTQDENVTPEMRDLLIETMDNGMPVVVVTADSKYGALKAELIDDLMAELKRRGRMDLAALFHMVHARKTGPGQEKSIDQYYRYAAAPEDAAGYSAVCETLVKKGGGLLDKADAIEIMAARLSIREGTVFTATDAPKDKRMFEVQVPSGVAAMHVYVGDEDAEGFAAQGVIVAPPGVKLVKGTDALLRSIVEAKRARTRKNSFQVNWFVAREKEYIAEARALMEKYSISLDAEWFFMGIKHNLPVAQYNAMLSDTGHGFRHALDVARYALEITAKEGAGGARVDKEAVVLGALLHDIYSVIDRKGHAALGAGQSGSLLKAMRFPNETAEKAAMAVMYHSYPADSHFPEDLPFEAKIIRDADELDEALNVERLVWINMAQMGRKFFAPGITVDERIRILRQPEPEGAAAQNFDCLQYLVRCVTCGIDRRNYLTQAAAEYIVRDGVLGENRARIVGSAGQRSPFASDAITKVVDAVIRGYWGPKLDKAGGAWRIDRTKSDVESVYEEFLDQNGHLTKTIFKGTEDVLVRVPVEAVEVIGPGNTVPFLRAIQNTPRGHVELYYASGTRRLTQDEQTAVLRKYGLREKPLPGGFKPARENTVSLFALLKGQVSGDEVEAKRDIDTLLSTSLGGVNPADTQVVPIGLQNDATGLVRGAVLGVQLLHIARYCRPPRRADTPFINSFIRPALEQYAGVMSALGVPGTEGLSPGDLVDLAAGQPNARIAALKKLISLMPVVPVDPEVLRRVYDLATTRFARAA
ncbi:MAG: aminotransferase class V-fold PLP-dependent enzyme [Candidatus Omnitrophota bacterium]